MKRLIFLLFVWVFVLLWAGSSSTLLSESKKPRFYIKLKGNASFSSGGNFGDFLDRNDLYFNELNNNADTVVSTTKRPFFQGFGGEIGVEVKKHAVGISIGYISRNLDIDYHYESNSSDYEENYVRKHKFSAIPIFLFIHYKLVDRRFIKAFLTIGEGVYLSTYREDLTMTFENADLTFANSYVKSKKNNLGFHVGASIDFNITRNLALFIDAGYRLVNFKEMKADDFYEDDNGPVLIEEQDFYYGTNRNTGRARFTAGEAGGMLWDEQLAELKLTGFNVNAGLKIIF
jgi:opacity protein-like surface antigen